MGLGGAGTKRRSAWIISRARSSVIAASSWAFEEEVLNFPAWARCDMYPASTLSFTDKGRRRRMYKATKSRSI
jgi:hypothetical protein